MQKIVLVFDGAPGLSGRERRRIPRRRRRGRYGVEGLRGQPPRRAPLDEIYAAGYESDSDFTRYFSMSGRHRLIGGYVRNFHLRLFFLVILRPDEGLWGHLVGLRWINLVRLDTSRTLILLVTFLVKRDRPTSKR